MISSRDTRRRHPISGAFLACLSVIGLSLPACATASIVGTVDARGPSLGDFHFAPDRCDWRADLRAADLSAIAHPEVTVRILNRPDETSPIQVVVANRAGPRGPYETVLTRAECAVLHGYLHRVRDDVGVAARFECALPDGQIVRGTVGAGECP